MTVKVSEEQTYWYSVPEMPAGYDYLPTGNAGLTRSVKAAAKKEGARLFLHMEKKSKRYPARCVGINVPSRIIENAKAKLRATEESRRKAKLRRQQREVAEFKELILEQFPHCPVDEAQEIAEWSCEIGSCRVGRSSVADDPVKLAVIAHIRHEHTQYDEIMGNMDYWLDEQERREYRRNAREDVAGDIEGILTLWVRGRPEVENWKEEGV